MCLNAVSVALIVGIAFIPAWASTAEDSVSTPTRLEAFALMPGVKMEREDLLTTITSPLATARVLSISIVAPAGSSLDGIKIELTNSTDQDVLYLERELVRVLSEELSALRPLSSCEAARCTRGIARCRPSQSTPQAYCVGYTYGSREILDGLMIRTPSGRFMFPGVEPEALKQELDGYNRQNGGGT